MQRHNSFKTWFFSFYAELFSPNLKGNEFMGATLEHASAAKLVRMHFLCITVWKWKNKKSHDPSKSDSTIINVTVATMFITAFQLNLILVSTLYKQLFHHTVSYPVNSINFAFSLYLNRLTLSSLFFLLASWIKSVDKSVSNTGLDSQGKIVVTW